MNTSESNQKQKIINTEEQDIDDYVSDSYVDPTALLASENEAAETENTLNEIENPCFDPDRKSQNTVNTNSNYTSEKQEMELVTDSPNRWRVNPIVLTPITQIHSQSYLDKKRSTGCLPIGHSMKVRTTRDDTDIIRRLRQEGVIGINEHSLERRAHMSRVILSELEKEGILAPRHANGSTELTKL